MLANEWGVGQMLWSLMWFFLFFLWIWLVIAVFADIIRSNELSGLAKAIWAIGIIFLPFIGVFIYLIVHGSTMGKRAESMWSMDHSTFGDAGGGTKAAESAKSANTAEELRKLGELRASGGITEDEFAQMKLKILNS